MGERPKNILIVVLAFLSVGSNLLLSALVLKHIEGNHKECKEELKHEREEREKDNEEQNKEFKELIYFLGGHPKEIHQQTIIENEPIDEKN